MPPLLSISRVLLPLLAALGFYTLHVFAQNNTLYPQILSHRTKRVLPTSTSASFPETFTGFDPLDGLLATLLVFFWPLIDGENPGASLLSFLFAGQAVAGWTATVLEGSRKMNQGRLISFTTVYGLLVQTMGFAFVGPLYLTLYAFTSPLLTSLAPLTPASLAVHEGVLTGHPLSLILGFILPTVLMSLPAPSSFFSLHSKITALLVWQFFPIWTSVLTNVWKSALWPTISGNSDDTDAPPYTQMARLRAVYKFALVISVPAHIATWSISAATVLFPGLFTPNALAALHPLHALVPPNPFDRTVTAASVAQGSHWFCQFDYYIMSGALLLWALATRYARSVEKRSSASAKSEQSPSPEPGVGSLVEVLGRCLLLGPMATALTLLWERDEIVFASADCLVVKKQL